jgi:23S rRNA (cytidine1920-2'-O)/16S rRNA (cytidine1409-2'-O)-methyltransferase
MLRPDPYLPLIMKKERADKILVGRGLAETRQKAQALIMAGLVSTAGRRVEKAGQPLDPDAPLSVEKTLAYVGRGGLKLEQALDEFAVDPAGRVCADIGSSTGGFTDCLLQRGAARVFCVDVDIRQLDDRIRRHPRVVTIEKNARNVVPADFPEIPGLIVMDVSFISVTKILPALRAVFDAAQPAANAPLFPAAPPLPATPPPLLLSLIKPQFEAGRGQVGKKGVIRDGALHAEILTRIISEAAALGFALEGLVRCATRGQKGNQEFFARFAPGRMDSPGEDPAFWIRQAVPEIG